VRSILLVEGDNETRRTIGDQLAELFPEARVLMTESGETGLELARRTWPSVVLLDLTLHGMGAFEFTARLRRLASGASVPIVGLAEAVRAAGRMRSPAEHARGEPENPDGASDALLRAEAAGLVGCLRKPVERTHLSTLLRPLLDRPR
jgi:CheY-like chemotaxis protein